jgi:signal transduction histidine kinase
MIACLEGFPAAVLKLSPEGVVLDSNGRLDEALGLPLEGRDFASLLDDASSRAKWERHRAVADASPLELVFHGTETLDEPRRFSLGREPDDDTLWLIEHPRDPRLDEMRRQVGEVNSDLAETQRALVREKSRLAGTLAEVERLAATVQAQNRELERSNRDLDEFAHVASHDLKAPLRAIRNYAQYLDEDAGALLPEEARGYLLRLRDRADRMGTMIDGVLQYARAGRTAAPVETVDTAALAREIVSLLDVPAGARVEVLPSLPTLRTERAPLQQVLLNLTQNALRHGHAAAPHVRIGAEAAEPEPGYHEYFVADNGRGVPPQLQERIWTLFHSLDPHDGRNSGIGLALVRRLVEAQGGRAWVESTPGEGACFRFLWPNAPRPRTP